MRGVYTQERNKMDAKERIAAEIKRIREHVNPETELQEKLIEEVAFMAVTIEALKASINADGPIIYGKNGNGFDVRQENPAQKSYNVMIKNYLTAARQLQDLLPEEEASNELIEFLKAGKK
jgi:hypothetical protein